MHVCVSVLVFMYVNAVPCARVVCVEVRKHQFPFEAIDLPSTLLEAGLVSTVHCTLQDSCSKASKRFS